MGGERMKINGKEYNADWTATSLVIRKQRGYKCEVCGRPACNPAESSVHHLDENTLNDKKENLVLLCNKCHLAFHRPNIFVRTLADFRYFVHQLKRQLTFNNF